MSEVELRERARIEFPHPVVEQETLRLFRYLADTLNCRVDYTVERSESFKGRRDEWGGLQTLGIKINGKIIPDERYYSKGCFAAPFSCHIENMNSDFDRVDGIEFFVTPGYDITEAPKGDLALFDDVRKKVGEYFSENRN